MHGHTHFRIAAMHLVATARASGVEAMRWGSVQQDQRPEVQHDAEVLWGELTLFANASVQFMATLWGELTLFANASVQ
jgi:hypothetical protein